VGFDRSELDENLRFGTGLETCGMTKNAAKRERQSGSELLSCCSFCGLEESDEMNERPKREKRERKGNAQND